MTLTEFELGWLSGLLEGEGYFGLRSDTKTPQIKLEMTDEDIVLRALLLIQRLTGKQHAIATVNRKGNRSHCQPTYIIALYSRDAIKVMKAVVRYMGSRRRQRIWQSLNGYAAKPAEELDVKALVASILDQKPQPKAEVISIKRRA